MDSDQIHELNKISLDMRRKALTMAYKTGSQGAHLGGGLSIIEIMAVLYKKILRVSPDNPLDDLRDRFILSKGHGTLALYTAMFHKGFFTEKELYTYKSNATVLYAHPSLNLKSGIEFSSGSLGQGVSLGVGSCLALRLRNNKSKVYVLVGDGECNEGSVWEAAASAVHYKLDNLIVIIDKNGLQYDGNTNEILSMDVLDDKWKSFGWQTLRVNGHDVKELYRSFLSKTHRPLVIIAETVKGKGVSFMENNPSWHHSVLSKQKYIEAMKELGVEI